MDFNTAIKVETAIDKARRVATSFGADKLETDLKEADRLAQEVRLYLGNVELGSNRLQAASRLLSFILGVNYEVTGDRVGFNDIDRITKRNARAEVIR